MKYSVGQKVKIRSLEWYRDNVNRYGIIECGKYEFFEPMNEYCGKVVTIKRIDDDNYRIDTDKGAFCWTDEMIEGLVEEESLTPPLKHPEDSALAMLFHKTLILPEGYQFVDENGNIINATKIVLEKKKKCYPKTYEECCKVMNYCCNPVATKTTHKEELIRRFQFLLLYRDAYWKIAGEEMGLGKPWEPDYTEKTVKYCLRTNYCRIVQTRTSHDNHPFSFPTEEMRDAFYENFKEDIEICKELL